MCPLASSQGSASGRTQSVRKRSSAATSSRKKKSTQGASRRGRHKAGDNRFAAWLTQWIYVKKKLIWWILSGALAMAAIYVLFLYYFFIGPTSFRWQAQYGDPVYPDGFKVHGVDVSHYQATIDWEQLRNASLNKAPVTFVIIKATEGESLIDDYFNLNFYEARRNDFVRGAYHFFLPDVDARKQARFFIRQVHLEPGDLPPVLDVEKIGNLSESQLRKAVKTWLDIVEQEYHVKPIIYTGYKFKMSYLNTPQFEDYPYWIAHYYVEKLQYKGTWHFWQHTDCGKVQGIRGNVDCNVFNGSVEDLKKLTIQEDDFTEKAMEEEKKAKRAM